MEKINLIYLAIIIFCTVFNMIVMYIFYIEDKLKDIFNKKTKKGEIKNEEK